MSVIDSQETFLLLSVPSYPTFSVSKRERLLCLDSKEICDNYFSFNNLLVCICQNLIYWLNMSMRTVQGLQFFA